MRFFALASLAVSVTLVACVAADGDSESNQQAASASDGGVATNDASASDGGIATNDASASVATWTEVAPLLADNCSGCHHSSFSTLAKVKQYKSQMYSAINAGRMPKDNTDWHNTPDGKTVLDFLQNSPELQ